jgi:hypothetical protein
MTTNPKGAVDFYTRLLGWNVTDFPGASTPYRMWTNKGNTLGGVMEFPAEAKKSGTVPHWLMYVGVSSVDDTFRQATRLGAQIHVKPTDIPTVGRFAVLKDPQGAAFAIFQPTDGGQGPSEGGDVGTFSWHELVTTDWKAAAVFYEKIAGWEKRDAHDMGDMGTYQLIGRPGSPAPLGGMMNKSKEVPAVGWNCYIRVPDIDRAAADIIRLGGKLVHPPVEVPGGDRIVKAFDPQGGAFALHWVKAKN